MKYEEEPVIPAIFVRMGPGSYLFIYALTIDRTIASFHNPYLEIKDGRASNSTPSSLGDKDLTLLWPRIHEDFHKGGALEPLYIRVIIELGSRPSTIGRVSKDPVSQVFDRVSPFSTLVSTDRMRLLGWEIWGGSDTKGYKLEWVHGHQVERGQLPNRMLQELLPKSLVLNKDIRELARPRVGGPNGSDTRPNTQPIRRWVGLSWPLAGSEKSKLERAQGRGETMNQRIQVLTVVHSKGSNRGGVERKSKARFMMSIYSHSSYPLSFSRWIGKRYAGHLSHPCYPNDKVEPAGSHAIWLGRKNQSKLSTTFMLKINLVKDHPYTSLVKPLVGAILQLTPNTTSISLSNYLECIVNETRRCGLGNGLGMEELLEARGNETKRIFIQDHYSSCSSSCGMTAYKWWDGWGAVSVRCNGEQLDPLEENPSWKFEDLYYPTPEIPPQQLALHTRKTAFVPLSIC
eukprot:Gb_08756 [translate_table: standard]